MIHVKKGLIEQIELSSRVSEDRLHAKDNQYCFKLG